MFQFLPFLCQLTTHSIKKREELTFLGNIKQFSQKIIPV